MPLYEKLFGFSKGRIEKIDGLKVSISEWNGESSLLNKNSRMCAWCGKKIVKGFCVNEASLLSSKLIGFFCDSCFKKYMSPEERKRRAEENERFFERLRNGEWEQDTVVSETELQHATSQNSVASKVVPQQPACCPKCKAPLKANANFCQNCGTRI